MIMADWSMVTSEVSREVGRLGKDTLCVNMQKFDVFLENFCHELLPRVVRYKVWKAQGIINPA